MNVLNNKESRTKNEMINQDGVFLGTAKRYIHNSLAGEKRPQRVRKNDLKPSKGENFVYYLIK